MQNLRIKASATIDKISKALVQAQTELSYAAKNAKNPLFKSTYAPLPEVIAAVKPILNKHGIGYFQPLGCTPDGKTTIITLLLHESGEYMETEAPIEGIEKEYKKRKTGQKDNRGIDIEEIIVETGQITPQKMASAITYYRRIILLSMLGVPTEDDDGNLASGKENGNLAINIHSSKTTNKKSETVQEAVKRVYQMDGTRPVKQKRDYLKENPDLTPAEVLNKLIIQRNIPQKTIDMWINGVNKMGIDCKGTKDFPAAVIEKCISFIDEKYPEKTFAVQQ